MAKITYTGIDGTMARLDALELGVRDQIICRMVYDGADIVADAVREEIERLPTSQHKGKPWFGRPGYLARGPSEEQKKGLLDSLGVSPMRNDEGFLNVSIGFDGYNRVTSKRWPRGEPNQMVARAVARGTSFMEANPFFKAAVNKTRSKAKSAMKKTAEKAIESVWLAGIRRAEANYQKYLSEKKKG